VREGEGERGPTRIGMGKGRVEGMADGLGRKREWDEEADEGIWRT